MYNDYFRPDLKLGEMIYVLPSKGYSKTTTVTVFLVFAKPKNWQNNTVTVILVTAFQKCVIENLPSPNANIYYMKYSIQCQCFKSCKT